MNHERGLTYLELAEFRWSLEHYLVVYDGTVSFTCEHGVIAGPLKLGETVDERMGVHLNEFPDCHAIGALRARLGDIS